MVTVAEQRARDLERVWYDTRRTHAEIAQGPAGDVAVRFNADFAQTTFGGDLVVNGSKPYAKVRDADAGVLRRGAELVVRGKRYRVADAQPGDAGETVLELEAL